MAIPHIIDFILPPRCPACARRVVDDHAFCAACWSDLTLISAPCCTLCGRPFDAGLDDGTVCGACLKRPNHFDLARSALAYDGKGRMLVLSLKNNRSFVGAPALAKLMLRALPAGSKFDRVMPVPLHPLRLLARRFNQSLLLARPLSKMLKTELDARTLYRRRHTVRQGHLPRHEREKNVRNAFAVRASRRHSVEGADILLVDDVITTGSTINACAKVLKKAGARHVAVVTVARVNRPIDA